MGAHARGIVSIQITKVQVARSLTVQVIDLNGSPMEGVEVEEMTPEWKETLRTTRTNASGVFTFTPVKGRRIYYIKLMIDGFNPMLFRLKVNRVFGKTIKMQMEVAT